jgi:hypothetical protein
MQKMVPRHAVVLMAHGQIVAAAAIQLIAVIAPTDMLPLYVVLASWVGSYLAARSKKPIINSSFSDRY